jgi:hypothetical protein
MYRHASNILMSFKASQIWKTSILAFATFRPYRMSDLYPPSSFEKLTSESSLKDESAFVFTLEKHAAFLRHGFGK